MASEPEVIDLAACCGTDPEPFSPDFAVDQAAVFKALSDPVRLRLLGMIAAKGPDSVCVCDLVGAFELSQPTISHHLKVLRDAQLVDCERRGTWVYYWVLPEAIEQAQHTLGHLRTGAATVTARPARG